MTAVCRRVFEQQEVDGTVQKGHTGVKDSVCLEEAGAVVEKIKSMSSPSAIRGGTDELGALQNEAGEKPKTGLLPLGKTCQILQWERQNTLRE